MVQAIPLYGTRGQNSAHPGALAEQGKSELSGVLEMFCILIWWRSHRHRHWIVCCPVKWKSPSRVRLCDPVDYTVHGILQARILEWADFLFSRRSSQPRDWTQVSHIVDRFFTSWATREAQEYWSGWLIPSPGDLPDPGIKPGSSALQAVSLPTELWGKRTSSYTFMTSFLNVYICLYTFWFSLDPTMLINYCSRGDGSRV